MQRETAARMGSGPMRGGPPPRGGDRGRRDSDYGMAPRGQMGMCASGLLATIVQRQLGAALLSLTRPVLEHERRSVSLRDITHNPVIISIWSICTVTLKIL